MAYTLLVPLFLTDISRLEPCCSSFLSLSGHDRPTMGRRQSRFVKCECLKLPSRSWIPSNPPFRANRINLKQSQVVLSRDRFVALCAPRDDVGGFFHFGNHSPNNSLTAASIGSTDISIFLGSNAPTFSSSSSKSDGSNPPRIASRERISERISIWWSS